MATQLFIGLITSSIGVGYFMWGRKRSRVVAMLAGALLCIYPYAVRSMVLSLVIGALLVVLPFVLEG